MSQKNDKNTRHLSELRTDNDTGFGSNIETQGGRLLNKNGTFNVHQKGMTFFDRFSIFHAFITMPIAKFILVVVLGYILVNLVFTLLYFWVGVEYLSGIITNNMSLVDIFIEVYFFSTQTLTTVGYGRVNPIGLAANIVSAFESLTGLMMFAIATGVLYGRFSQPLSKVKYSENALVAPFQNGQALMFRLANPKKNQLIDINITVFAAMAVLIDQKSGERQRKFFPLELERSRVNFLALSWTVVHPINERSPFWGMTEQEVADADTEVMVLISGFDDTYNQTIHSRNSYKWNEFIWNAKFNLMYHKAPDNQTTILDLDKINAFTRL